MLLCKDKKNYIHCHRKWTQFILYSDDRQNGPMWSEHRSRLTPHIHVCRSRFTTLWHNIRAINVSYVPWAHALSRFIDCCFQKYKMYTALANKTSRHSAQSSEERPSAALSISWGTEWNWSMTLISDHDRCVCRRDGKDGVKDMPSSSLSLPPATTLFFVILPKQIMLNICFVTLFCDHSMSNGRRDIYNSFTSLRKLWRILSAVNFNKHSSVSILWYPCYVCEGWLMESKANTYQR